MLTITKKIKLEGLEKPNAINVFLYGDTHRDDPGFYMKGWNRMVEDIENTPNSYVIEMGDILDKVNRRTLTALKASSVPGMDTIYDTLDDKAKEAEQQHIEECRPFAPKLLCAVIGNHGWEYFNVGRDYGKTVDENWSKALGVPLSKGLATVRFNLAYGNKKANYRIMCRHGFGGARTETGDQNKLMQELYQYDDVDLFAAGHTHHHYARKLKPRSYFYPNGEVVSRNLYVCRTGSFKRHFRDDPMNPSYEEMAGYSNSGLGYIKATIWMRRRQNNGKDVVYAQSEVTAVPVD